MKDYKPSPDEVRALRELRGQSIEEAAQSINYTHLSWRQWERGKTEMPACAWAVYRLGGLYLADALDSSDKLGVRQVITAVFELPKLPRRWVSEAMGQKVHEVQQVHEVAEAREPTAIAKWAVSRDIGPVYDEDGERVYTVCAWWGTTWYDTLLTSIKVGDKSHFPVYDDIQDWIADPRERRAFADHFNFDYLEEV